MCVCFFFYIYIYFNLIFFFFFFFFFFFLYYFLRFSIQHRVSVQWVEYPEEICYIIISNAAFRHLDPSTTADLKESRYISRCEEESSGKPIKKKNLWSHLQKQKKTKKKERKKERKNKKKQSKII